MFKSLQKLFGGSKAQQAPVPYAPPPDPEPQIEVPDLQVVDLLAMDDGDVRPLILDVRERYEWDQVHLPEDGPFTVRHIPMNSVPDRLGELPTDQPIGVLCAHGNRSFGVAHYLIEQGFDAHNIAGGITQWHIRGGDVVVRRR
jgi:rhodanese-related sulfurtransferase